MELSNFVILYVDNVQRSVDFYRPLLERDPVEHSEGFAMFVSQTGTKFGLWQQADVLPELKIVEAGAMEVAFIVPNKNAVQVAHSKWLELGVQIIQETTEMDFGTTFMGLDPDGHRLRLYCVEKQR